LAELVAVRSAAYSRHNAPGAEQLKVAETQDRSPDVILLIAKSKLDDAVLGSVRIHTRLAGPLMVEAAMTLPGHVLERAPVELMRGSVKGGASGRMVSAALAKACYLICVELRFTHIIVTCRVPVDSMYGAYQFDDLLGGKMISLPYSPGAQHRVLCLPIAESATRWQQRNGALFDFMLSTVHSDIKLDYELIRQRLKRTVETATPVEA
jgi:hypothetical protein